MHSPFIPWRNQTKTVNALWPLGIKQKLPCHSKQHKSEQENTWTLKKKSCDVFSTAKQCSYCLSSQLYSLAVQIITHCKMRLRWIQTQPPNWHLPQRRSGRFFLGMLKKREKSSLTGGAVVLCCLEYRKRGFPQKHKAEEGKPGERQSSPERWVCAGTPSWLLSHHESADGTVQAPLIPVPSHLTPTASHCPISSTAEILVGLWPHRAQPRWEEQVRTTGTVGCSAILVTPAWAQRCQPAQQQKPSWKDMQQTNPGDLISQCSVLLFYKHASRNLAVS